MKMEKEVNGTFDDSLVNQKTQGGGLGNGEL